MMCKAVSVGKAHRKLLCWSSDVCVFFFQAEDGIRDYDVTGVQTCALPIWLVFELNVGVITMIVVRLFRHDYSQSNP